MRFTKAIVRTPGASMVDGLTSAGSGKPDYAKALVQHAAYIRALESCGLRVTVLPADEAFPDSTFVEDPALVTPAGAIIMRPGAESRRGETAAIEQALAGFFPNFERIVPPGTVDAGDIMMVGDHYYIGLSKRTNAEGAAQVIAILEAHGLTGSTVPLKHILHLKSAAAYLEDRRIVLGGELTGRPEFSGFDIIPVEDDEKYAANCLWINDRVLVAAGFPKMQAAIRARGFETIPLPMSEFRKLDGGLSCLSLRF
ncbi:MAG: N(G),N(G)-dimethylarginine dimethylaminohydrolase [candidate division Zixibacteria bacterium]|nr:N(G),N(G)-dimethylarginine dimethylaminohydrolase [candidate division Zixibacteria bacterium]